MADTVKIELSREAAQHFLDNCPPVEYLGKLQKEFLRALEAALEEK